MMLRITEEFVWIPSQRPECNESPVIEFHTAGTVPDDDEFPPNFTHSAGRYRGALRKG